jgi:hypothetical protein
VKDDRRTFSIEFSSQNWSATATIEVKAHTVEQAIAKAEACLHADFRPQLMNFYEVS